MEVNKVVFFEPKVRYYFMGVAILLVILHHCLCARGCSSLVYSFFGGIFANCNVGVNIFFLLSSYGLCFSIERNSIKKFYFNRIVRIFPVYLFFLLIYFLITRDPLFREKVFNAFSMRAVFGDVGVDWYVPCQLFIYAIFPLLYFFMSKFFQKKYFFFGCFIILLLINYKLYKVVQPKLAYRLSCILSGIVFYYCEKTNNEKLAFSYCIFSCIFSFLTIAPYSFFYLPLLLLCFVRYGHYPLQGYISMLGKYSLEIYLAQFIGLETIYRQSSNNMVIDLINGLCVTVMISFILIVINKSYNHI